MRFKNFLKHQNGIGLIEVMVAVAITGGLALTLAKLMDNAGQSAKQIEAKSENTNLKGILQDILNNTTACKNTFGVVMTPANVTTLSGSSSASVSVPNIKDKVNAIKYTPGVPTSSIDPLTITSMELTNYNATAFTGDLIVQSNFRKSSSMVMMVKAIRIPINFNFTSGAFTSCSTMAVGGEWLLGGNAGTVDGTDYVGTSDTAPLNFKVNAIPSGRIDTTGATFFGYSAGRFNSNGAFNTGFGSQALGASTTGTGNTALGQNAGSSITTGSNNIMIGKNTGTSLTIGNSNIAIGGSTSSFFSAATNSKLYIDSSGAATPLIGGDFTSDYVQVAGKVAIDGEAGLVPTISLSVGETSAFPHNGTYVPTLYAVNDVNGHGVGIWGKKVATGGAYEQWGVRAECSATTGVSSYCNGLIGTATYGTYTGSGRAYGVKAYASNGTAGYNYGLYASLVGASTVGAAVYSNITYTDADLSAAPYNANSKWSGVFVGPMYVNGQIYSPFTTITTSDKRLKKDIKTLDNSLEKILKLRGVSYFWKKGPGTGEQDKEQIGLIAQEVEEQYPQLVSTSKANDGVKAKSLNYPQLVAPIIEAIKELYAKFVDQQSEIDELKAENAKLKKQVESIDARMSKLEAKKTK